MLVLCLRLDHCACCATNAEAVWLPAVQIGLLRSWPELFDHCGGANADACSCLPHRPGNTLMSHNTVNLTIKRLSLHQLASLHTCHKQDLKKQ